MKSAIIAVLGELAEFVFVERFGFRELPSRSMFFALPAPSESVVSATYTQSDTSDYVYISAREVLVHKDPVRAFDNVIGKLSYADRVQKHAHGGSGRWIEVSNETIHGWVLRDVVVDAPHVLLPKLKTGVHYDAYNQETIKLRTVLHDMFYAQDLALDLQDVEYVAFRLLQSNKNIEWGSARPRIGGLWHEMLKENQNVYASMSPKALSIMEYVTDDGVGHLAFVEAVFSSDTIQVSEVGHEGEGVYSERVLEHETWRECRPIFMSVI